jgi:hypothetical protein
VGSGKALNAIADHIYELIQRYNAKQIERFYLLIDHSASAL